MSMTPELSRWSRFRIEQVFDRDRRDEDECWIWTGYVGQSGHGHMTVRGRTVGVHRVSAWMYLGLDMDSDLVVHHTCENKTCFNPQHLELMTKAEHDGI